MGEIQESGTYILISAFLRAADYYVHFERNDKSLHSNNDSERSIVYTDDFHEIKTKENK